MIKIVKNIIDIYLGVPSLTKRLLPVVITEHLVISFCLNISVYFKKVDHYHYSQIGQFISNYYWGCLLGALVGGTLTLYYRTTKISGLCLIALSGCLYSLFSSSSPGMINLAMFCLGGIGTIAATSNITSLIRSARGNNNYILKIISLELILFNLSFSFITFILLDLNIEYLTNFIESLIILLVISGLWAFTFNHAIFRNSKSKRAQNFVFLPEYKLEFFILVIMILCFGLIFSMVKVIFTPTLIDRFGSNLLSVTAASINPWIIFCIQPLIIERVKKTNSTWFLGLGGLLVGLSYFLFGIATSFVLTTLSLILLTFGEMLFSPLSKHFAVQLYDEGQEGVASGLWKAVFLGSGVLGPKLSGYVAEYYSNYIVWKCCALLGMICFILSLFLRKERLKTSHNRVILNN
ncbi:MFS transporter [Legionella sp. CNM-1927-20]|uniref:MFS transporter n=1 Tax=Legionella sp. CNM-1927-20 TaxID=3422221 RepID=UPI00403AC922